MPDLGLHQSLGALVRMMFRYSATSFSLVGNSPAQMEELTIRIAVLETCRYVQVCMVYTNTSSGTWCTMNAANGSAIDHLAIQGNLGAHE